MSRAARKSAVELTEREIAEARFADAQAANTRARDTLTAARKAVMAAEELWEESSDDDVQVAREARDEARRKLDDLEREGEYRRSAKQLELATRNLADAVKKEKEARLEVLKPRLAAFATELEETAVKWVAIDREAERLAGATAEATSAHHALYIEAKALALDLGVAIAELGPAADRAAVALMIRKTIGAARREDGAEHRSDVVRTYLEAPSEDWRTADMSASAQADLDRTIDRNRAIAHDAEIARAHAAGVAAGRQHTPEPKTAGKEMPS